MDGDLEERGEDKMTLTFICCPKCHSPISLERIGPVGKRGVKDSRKILCTSCNYPFRSKGQTIWESMGHVKP